MKSVTAKSRLKLSVGGVLIGMLAAGSASAQTYGAFGDNIADPGNIPAILEAANEADGTTFDTNFPASPPNFENRYSNGLTAAELLPDLLDTSFTDIQQNAVGNAFSDKLPVSLAGGILLGNGSAIPGPIGRELTPLNNTDIATQVDQFLARTGPLGESDFALLYPSGNDGALALNTIALTMPSEADALQITVSGAQVNGANTATSAQKLLSAGAGTVLVSNLPNIGLTPAAQAGGLSGQQLATLFSATTNQALLAGLSTLDAGDSTLIVADTFALNNDIVANPTKYGFSDVTNPCSLVPSCVGASREVQDQFLFWDVFFPTARGHEISAAFLADTLNAPRTVPALSEEARYATERHARTLLDVGGQGTGMWIDGSLGYSRYERGSAVYAAGYEAEGPMVNMAFGWTGESGLSLGVAGAYSDVDVDFTTLVGGYDRQSFNIGAFVGYESDIADLSLSVSYGFDDFEDIQRMTGVADQTSVGATEGESFAILGQISHDYAINDVVTLTPLARLGYSRAEFDGFTESGATGLSQIVEDGELEKTFAEIGVGIAHDSDSIHASLAGVYHVRLDDNEQVIRTSLVSLPDFQRTAFVAAPDRSYARAEGEFGVYVAENIDIGIVAEGAFASDNFDYVAGQAYLRWRF